ncbi:protein adenylyltransferase SelO [Actinospongicola halichondriae]|uniref:protein adenylyltransferase SelO n=1 Tax=Actinospongicola halichondriae TaxID=3236844 RepID=UPI003D5735A2
MEPAATIDLDHRFADALPDLAVEWAAAPVPTPSLVAYNPALAAELGLDDGWLRSPEGVAVLAGNAVPEGAKPVAMGYAGHQFGNYSPRLGDGRALLLGEVTAPDGRVLDLHLKGSGRTPYARGGDGRATLGPMLREFLVSEAMHALGIPTTRSLAVVTTGQTVARSRPEPGAVLTRVAASHLRVGTFEYARWLYGGHALVPLIDHAVERHVAPGDDASPAMALLRHTVEVQAELVARWMLVGFVHGVLNTDNVTISGEGIDYGPCAFMDAFDPATVFSSIDHAGRYAYGNQPAIAQWNLTRLAESLLPAIDDDRDTAVALATGALEQFVDRYQGAWSHGMAAKLGVDPDQAGNSDLFDGLVSLQTRSRADHTSTYRALADELRGDPTALAALFPGHGPEVEAWSATWRSALGAQDPAAVADAMDRVNPVYIPRNHLVEAALDDAAVGGDLTSFERLLDLVTDPYVERAGHETEARPAPDGFDAGYQTFCGT